MPEMLSPSQAAQTTVALPPGSAAQPVEQKPRSASPPPSPFRTSSDGPRILILPHQEAESPSRQSRDDSPSRFAAQAPPGGMAVRGIFYRGGERLPAEATQAHPASSRAPSPRTDRRSRLRDALRRKRGG